MKTVDFSQNFEREIEDVGHHVQSSIENANGRNIAEREAVKNAIRSLAEKIPVINAGQQSAPVPQSSTRLPAYLTEDVSQDEIKKTVESLIDIALSEGLEKAINASQKHPPFIADAFHDALVDKMIPELKKRGILK